jgi:hypothetical protein
MSIAAIIYAYRQTHERALSLVAPLRDDQLAWRPDEDVHSIAWNLWHLARWADLLQEYIPRMTVDLGQQLGVRQQIWTAEHLVERWGLPSAVLGYDATGSQMDDAAASGLGLPEKEVLLDYVRRAFTAADDAVGAVDEQQAKAPDATNEDFNAAYYGTSVPAEATAVATVAGAILEHLMHENCHLGEMACLRTQVAHRGLRHTAE